MAIEVSVTICPSCGAPVDPAAHRASGDASCPYCDRVLPHRDAKPKAPKQPRPPKQQQPKQQRAAAARAAAGSGRGCGLAIAAVVVVVVAAVGVPILLAAREDLAERRQVRLAEDPVALPSDGGHEALVAVYRTGTEGRLVQRVDVLTGRVAWTSEPFEGPGALRLVPGNPVVVVVAGEALVGLDHATGDERWRQTLTNEVQSCEDVRCAEVVAGHVVVLSKDGNVQSFDVATGRPAWTERLTSTPRYLDVLADRVLVDDRGEDGHVLAVYDPASGAERRLEPSCPLGGRSTEVARPEAEEDWVPVRGTTTVVALLHEGRGCLGGYDVTTGGQVWLHPHAEPDGELVPFTWTGEAQSRRGGFLWTTSPSGSGGSRNELWTVDPGTGRPTRLATDAVYDFEPVGVVDGVAVTLAAPRYDAQRPEVWAVDLATSAPLWKQASRVEGTVTTQAVGLGRGVVAVTSCEGTKGGFEKPCTYEALDPRSGVTRGTSSTKQSLIPSVELVAAFEDVVVVRHSGQLVVLDPATAAVRATYGQP